eukprot:8668519-Ditylum_brightwellii.AAC.1
MTLVWSRKGGVTKETSAKRRIQLMNCTWSVWYVMKKKMTVKVIRRMKKIVMLVSLMKAYQ